MAIRAYGVDASVTEALWAELHHLAGKGSHGQVVPDGDFPITWTTTPQAGGLTIGAGSAYVPGVLVKSDAATTMTVPALATSYPRVDLIVLQVDWSGTSTTGGTLVRVPGTPGPVPVEPSLKQNVGVLWQVPLARIHMTIDPTQNRIERCAPRPRRPFAYQATIPAGNPTITTTPFNVTTLEIPDPGWPYTVLVSGAMRFQRTPEGTSTTTLTEYEWNDVRTRTEYQWRLDFSTTEWEWRQLYGSSSSHPTHWQHVQEWHYEYRWGTSSTTAPFFPSTISHGHYGTTSEWYSDDLPPHSHSKSGSPQWTGNRRTTNAQTFYYWSTSATTPPEPGSYRTGLTRQVNYVAGTYWSASRTTSDPNDTLTGRTRTSTRTVTTAPIGEGLVQVIDGNSGTLLTAARTSTGMSDPAVLVSAFTDRREGPLRVRVAVHVSGVTTGVLLGAPDDVTALHATVFPAI